MKKIIPLVFAVLFGAALSFAQAAPLAVSAQIGKQVTLAVTVTGSAPFTYQWRKIAAGAPVGTVPTNLPAPAGMAANLVLLNVQNADAGTYDVIVSNPAGSATSNQGIISITLIPPTVTGLTSTVQ